MYMEQDVPLLDPPTSYWDEIMGVLKSFHTKNLNTPVLSCFILFVSLSVLSVVIKRVAIASLRNKKGMRPLVALIEELTRGYMLISGSFAIATTIYPIAPLINQIAIVSILASTVWRALRLLDQNLKLLVKAMLSKMMDSQRKNVLVQIHVTIRVAIWTAGVLFLLENCGLNISAILRSLEIGGLAVAIAGRTLLVDFIAGIGLFLDKPFVVGDHVFLKEQSGFVKKIGIKKTTLIGNNNDTIIVPNSELSDSIVRRYSASSTMAVLVKLSLSVDTPPELIKHLENELPETLNQVSSIVEDSQNFLFKELSPYAINIEIRFSVACSTSESRLLRHVTGQANTK